MTTASQMFTDRDTAGAAYATAVTNLRSAWINLKALDLACSNRNVLAALPSGTAASKIPVQTLGNPSDLRMSLEHPVYSRGVIPAVAEWQQSAEASALTLINGLG